MKLSCLLVVSLTWAACGGGEGDDPPVDSQTSDTGGSGSCTKATFDPCTDLSQCSTDAVECHLFQMDGFQVCTVACTPNDNSTCPVDSTGANATCNNRGICKPAAANACTP